MPLIAAVFDKYFVPLRPRIKNILWQMKDMMNMKEDNYIKFKHLLEYFVSHLEWCKNNDTSFIGYDKYIKPLRDIKKFKYSGQGWKGGQIQEQIEQWAHYEEYTICINVYAANYQSNACYLNGEDTWINVRPLWDNDHVVKLYLSKEEKSSAKEEKTKTIKELGLFDNKEPNSIIKAFFDEYEKMILEYNGLSYNKLMMEQIKEFTQILNIKKNIILQGAPGTGKTYNTAALALSICGVKDGDKFMVREDGKDSEYVMKFSDHSIVMKKYEELQKEGRIGFCTFHQSMDYEDFVEGIKPKTTNGQITYEVEPGIFKTMCKNAINKVSENFVLIIDEINRGNVSKIFGELITLLEADKRIGVTEEEKKTLHTIWLTLPYSKKPFGVPSNLYIIGTMNTTDRSVGNIDYAVRRRFAFVTLKAERELVEQNSIPTAVELFKSVELFLQKHRIDMDFDDLMVGHSYFFAKDENELTLKWKYEILPLLNEYIKDNIVNDKTISSNTPIADFVNTDKPKSQSDTIENNE